MDCDVYGCCGRAVHTLHVKATTIGAPFWTYLNVCRPHDLLAQACIKEGRARWTLIPGIDDTADRDA